MYQLAISRDFIARHYLISGDWGEENLEHSHHYRVEVMIESAELDKHGYLVDIVDLEQALNTSISEFREQTLNDLKAFRNVNPSLERFARILSESILRQIALPASAINVKLWENQTDWAAYRSQNS